MDYPITPSRTLTFTRRFARVMGTLLLILVLFIAVGSAISEGLGPLGQLTSAEIWMFFALFIMLAGTVAGWWWDGMAGMLLIGGYALFVGINYSRNQTFDVGWVLAAFPLVGLVYLICWWRGR